MRLLRFLPPAFLALLAACGGTAAPPAASPSTPPARAEGTQFVETSPDGKLNWEMTVERIVHVGDTMRGDSLCLRIVNADSSSTRLPAGVRSSAGNGCTAVASAGVIRNSGMGMLVELSGGYTLLMASGWQAVGPSLAWDGAILQTRDSVVITRGRTFLMGDNARIDPRRDFITVDNVSGFVEDLSL